MEQNSLKKWVAVFPGQGSQQIGMGKNLFENFALAKQTFEEASDAVRIDLKKLCFEGPENDLTLTENTQPCLLTTSVAAFRVVAQEFDFFPTVVAGHSLGEYSALVAIGAIPLGLATQWVRERGLSMQKAVPPQEGAMAAILGLSDEAVALLCTQATTRALENREQGAHAALSIPALVSPANFNAPGQVVIAGSADGILEAIDLLKSGAPEFSGGRAIPLAVSAPFHCSLMAPAQQRMAEIFASVPKPQPLRCPYIPNRTARLSRETQLIFDFLIEQVDHPVLWRQSIQNLFETPFDGIVEMGPGKILSGLIKRISSPLGKTCALTQVSDTSTLKTFSTLLQPHSA